MSPIIHTVRILVGLSLVAGGAVLAQPFALVVLQARQQAHAPAAFIPPAPAAASEAFGLPGPAGQPAGVLPRGVDPLMALTAGNPPTQGGAAGRPAGFMPEFPAASPPPARLPPAPPAALPRSEADLAPAPPTFDAAYRSTLDIPPPPLLDTQSPPPLSVGWSTHAMARPAAAAADEAVSPPAYVVRDGDDLTGIALRVYGTAGAATAIWAANRDRLQDPQLLPIGMTLRMPPSWTLPSAHAGDGRAIEPSFAATTPAAADAAATASWRTARPAAAEPSHGGATSWLQPGDGMGHGAVPPPPAPAFASRPATLRVAAGDTLESIAARHYGDAAAAARIWQANRDRLRSPDLLVVGMELRLP